MKNESLINSMFLIWGMKDFNIKFDVILLVFFFVCKCNVEKDIMK